MEEKLKVFFDGQCILCHREMIHYKSIDKLNKIEFIDITDESFLAEDYGLDPDEINIHIHSIYKNKVFKGVDTFIEVWKRIPPYDKVVPIAEKFKPLFKSSYNLFALYIRPFLPKRSCDDGYCDTKNSLKL